MYLINVCILYNIHIRHWRYYLALCLDCLRVIDTNYHLVLVIEMSHLITHYHIQNDDYLSIWLCIRCCLVMCYVIGMRRLCAETLVVTVDHAHCIDLFLRPCLCYQLQSIEQNMYVLL